jgi:hypothetical protein
MAPTFMARLDCVAVGAYRVGFLPRPNALSEDVELVVVDEPLFGEFHRGFPLALSFGLFAFFGDAPFLEFGCFEL